MQKTPVTIDLSRFPAPFHSLLSDAAVFDSSSSPQARVWFVDKKDGFYLKKSAKGALCREAEMTRFFHSKGVAAEVLAYESLDDDWLLTAAADGEDGISDRYLADPGRLCLCLAEVLHTLHGADFAGCPVPDRTADYMATAERNYRAGMFDPAHFPEAAIYPNADAAWQAVCTKKHLLGSDTLIHGDFCLPNIILNNWRPSALIDFDNAGVGDRHVDLFWAIWSLRFNLKTDRWGEYFLDAYGRDRVNPEVLQLIAAIEVFG